STESRSRPWKCFASLRPSGLLSTRTRVLLIWPKACLSGSSRRGKALSVEDRLAIQEVIAQYSHTFASQEAQGFAQRVADAGGSGSVCQGRRYSSSSVAGGNSCLGGAEIGGKTWGVHKPAPSKRHAL